VIQIRTKSLGIGYNYKPVLKGINIQIEYGDFICITGENGIGKSTLIKTILGLYPAISGKIIYDKNTPLNTIGYLSQRLDVQNDFPATVWEVVLSGCLPSIKHRLFYTLKEKKMAIDNLKLLGISDIKKKPFKELSGGQAQRVLIARALCATQKLLILDEPFTALDSKMTKELESVIKDINEKTGVTILMITHNIEYSINDCNKIFYLAQDGCKTLTKEEYLKARGEMYDLYNN